MNALIEVCTGNLEDALKAGETGAGRIELAQALEVGGVTPSYALIRRVTEKLSIPVHVLIRPRTGDFVYSPAEISIMAEDIEFCREAGAAGVVFGVLTPDGGIDETACRFLISKAAGLSCTFHRAWDLVARPDEWLEKMIDMGFDRILTSGGEPHALTGARNIRRWRKAVSNRIGIMPGSGITPANIADLYRITRSLEYHMSASNAAGFGLSTAGNENLLRQFGGYRFDARTLKRTIENLQKALATYGQANRENEA
ncbi:MAG: copper homeostasis protein CutC [Bacteroidales bacterium]